MANPLPSEVKRTVPLWMQMLVWAGLLGLLALVAFGLLKVKTSILSTGSIVPEFTLPLYEGYGYNGLTEINITTLGGKVVLINFWASWCKPCESEAADLEAAWRKYQASGNVLFIGIDYVDTINEARSYLAKFDITYPNGPDKATRISQIFNRDLGVPETYFIDGDGVLRYTKIGPFTSVEEIQEIIESILAGE